MRTKKPFIVALVAAAAFTVTAPGIATASAGATAHEVHASDARIQCPGGFVCIYPGINFQGQPYVKRASDGGVKHLPDYIRSRGSSVINNSSRTARVYQKDNFHGRRVCVSSDGGSIQDLRSYNLNDETHSLKINDTRCGG